MKSRLVALLTAFTLAITLAACGDSGKEAADKAAAAAKDSQMKAQAAAKDAADKAAAASKDAAAAVRRAADATKDANKAADSMAPKDSTRRRRSNPASRRNQNAGFAPAFCFAARRTRQPDFGAACRAIQRVSGFHCSQSCSARERGRSNTVAPSRAQCT